MHSPSPKARNKLLMATWMLAAWVVITLYRWRGGLSLLLNPSIEPGI
ncbi:hypothetical protein JHL22_15235 [Advenella sp. WQ 585]|uniref:Uncharacterized protein n=2 Tax=Advenella TaxID=290425 RepID=A0ABS6NLH7_9BURK|nr:hypothetical protein [Advenella mandrilli]MBK1782565.1 hypothetical protein [Advenella mandrilli]MBV4396493.1 hypothetical protein [Advenella alkanexedens]